MPQPLETLLEDSWRAWSDLAASAVTVAALPGRALADWLGAPWPLPPGPGERLTVLEAERGALLQALGASKGALVEIEARLATERALVEELRARYVQLEQSVSGQLEQAVQDERLALYRRLESMLTQLPGVRRAIAEGNEVAAADVLSLLAPLDAALAGWGFTPIGEVGERLAFDQSLHHAVRPAAPGDPVVVRHVGYRFGPQVLRKAKVAPEA
ncbi:MAG TPA: hypothetical protein V6D47_18085 [Oscillatoriaceae cyanobacterium]